jgi:dCTP diphosphatase
MNNKKKKFELEEIIREVIEFRDKRNWKKFHNPKNLAISISIEANELLEHFQWKDLKESKEYAGKNKDEISLEIADIIIYLLYLCHDLNIDIMESIEKKLKENNSKYPISKSKGKSLKYNQL